MIHTGDGKGKSTAAFGLALRGWNQGWSIGVFQFVKSAKWRIGEQSALEALGKVHEQTGAGGPVEWHKMGAGWSWSRKAGTEDDHAAAAREGWQEIKRRLAAQVHQLYVLDEFSYPITWGWIDVEDVATTLTSRPGHQHVIITGRNVDTAAARGRFAGHGDDQDQASLRLWSEGPAGHRVVTVLPRVVIAAPGSAHGKTTVATGLMAAMRGAGLEVSGFKVGPDYIDPGYHTLATGRPARNLDPHLCPPDQLVPLLLHGASTPRPADVAVIEGVMGLFDGQIGGEGFASTAHVATLVDAPVILVLDISQVSRTTAAIVHGLNTFDPAIRLSGVILNKAGSARHAAEITSAMEATGIEVLGVLPRDAGIEAPSRHLGLIPAAERQDAAESIRRLAAQIRDHVSVTKIMRVAHTARPLDAPAWAPGDSVRPPSKARPVVAVAGGRAFTFRYPETDELLNAAGCEPVVFDPLTDTELPAGTAGIYLGGGFPEVHASELSANASLRSALRAAIAAGTPTVAECAGLLYVCRTVDGRPMVGAIPADGGMTQRLTLRYRSLLADHDHLLAPEGGRVTGHEFHRTAVEPLRGRPRGLAGGRGARRFLG